MLRGLAQGSRELMSSDSSGDGSGNNSEQWLSQVIKLGFTMMKLLVSIVCICEYGQFIFN